MIIGICGKSGAGKSTLAKQIVKQINSDVIYLDIDKIGHKVLLYPDVKKELIKSFGKCILEENNIDRKKLGEIVFNSRHEMNRLSDITWKHMQIEIDKYLKENENKMIILDWILLPISKYFNICDVKILLDIPYNIRKQRAIKRDNITEEEFDLREKASIDFNKFKFDYVLNTNYAEVIIKRLVNLL